MAATAQRKGRVLQRPVFYQPAERLMQGDPRAGYGRGAGAAVGLQNVAVQMHRALAQSRQIGGGA